MEKKLETTGIIGDSGSTIIGEILHHSVHRTEIVLQGFFDFFTRILWDRLSRGALSTWACRLRI